MAENEIKVRLQSAYKTESEWTASNPILKEGEVGYVADSNVPNYGRYKIGDGATTWKNLPWGDQNIQEKFDDLEIGGRNLLLNSEFKKISNHGIFSFSDGVITINSSEFGKNDYNTRHIINLSDYSSECMKNKEITVSFEYYIESEITYGTTAPWVGAQIAIFKKSSGTDQWLTIFGGKNFPTSFTGNWVKASRTFKVMDYDISSARFTIYFEDTKGIVKFRHIKLEIGNKATDWTPAPEDKADVSHTHPASDISSGTLSSDRLPTIPVSKGGTGLTSLTSGQALIGNGTGAITTRAIDTTSGGTSGSTGLITSGAVYAGLSGKANSSHTHNSILDAGNNTSVTTFAYSKSGLSYSDYTWLAGWNGYELRAINKNQFATASHTHNYAGSSSAGGAANSLAGFTNTTTSATAIDSATQNGHVYVSGTSGIYSQSDGAAFVQAYSASWVAQIYQDYRTGQIALRGKNNGTWQPWRKVLDSSNYTSYCLPKTTYEYNKELSLGSSGKVCIGVFPCYDSNISVEIKSTTNITYHGTLIIATQNINTSGGGSYSATVYGDEKNTLTPEIKIQYASGSNAFSIYINLPAWSKNLLHIQCAALAGTPSNIATVVDSIPSTATIVPINAFTHTHNYAGSSSAGGSATSAVKLDSSAGTATQPIYFSGGKPVLCTYGLNATVPSGAVFTDTKVTQTAINASDYTYWRPLVIGNSNSSTEGFTPSSVTDGVITAATITCQPNSGTIRATTFKGALSGNAATATKASQDASGNTITSSYAASLSVSGRTLTLKSKSGATLSTVTTQDTTYSAVTRSSNGLMIASDKVKLDGLIPLTDAEIDEIFNEATSGVEELDSIYPVGSVYISINHTNPGTIFGGTWERFGNGKVLVGVDENDTDFSTVEQSGGEKEHVLTTAEMPSHSHTSGTLSANSVGGHTHSVSATAADNGDHYHHMNQIWSSGAGGSNAYVLSSGRSAGWRNTGNAGTHGHSVSGTAQSNGGHSHTISGASDSTGNGKSHNNLQPYITVYMWLRTA